MDRTAAHRGGQGRGLGALLHETRKRERSQSRELRRLTDCGVQRSRRDPFTDDESKQSGASWHWPETTWRPPADGAVVARSTGRSGARRVGDPRFQCAESRCVHPRRDADRRRSLEAAVTADLRSSVGAIRTCTRRGGGGGGRATSRRRGQGPVRHRPCTRGREGGGRHRPRRVRLTPMRRVIGMRVP